MGARAHLRCRQVVGLILIAAGIAGLAAPLIAQAKTKPKAACNLNARTLCKALRRALDREVAAYVRSHKSQLVGAAGPAGPAGPTGPAGPATGAAGGDLSGTFPNPTVASVLGGRTPLTTSSAAGGALAGTFPAPTLNVTGGPCPNGKALTDVSSAAVLTCAAGVYRDGGMNIGVGGGSFGGGTNNTAVGANAMSQDTGNHNSAFGFQALTFNVGASGNSAFGDSALATNISGNVNSAFGEAALQNNQSGSSNSAFGHAALAADTAGGNSAFGELALQANTGGSDNVAVGADALQANTAGSNNTAIGWNTNPGATGSSNVLVGAQSGFNYNTSESSNIDISNAGTTGESHVIHLGLDGSGTSQQNAVFIAGDHANIGAQATAMINTSTGQLGVNSSSRRFKRDVHPVGGVLGPLMALEPVSFYYKPQFSRDSRTLQYGLIAEDVARHFPNLVIYGPDGRPFTVRYEELPVLLLAQLQAQQRQIDGLRREVAALHAGRPRLK